jgi:uncharacterized Zn finger protein
VSGFGQLDLWRLAGKQSYERGEHYVDAVTRLRPITGGVRATVYGSEPYRVALMWAGGELTGDCSCPYGSEGNFCKHCVAVGLSWIDRAEADGADADAGVDSPDVEITDLRFYLASLDHDTLVDLLCEHAEDDDDLYDQLVLMAAQDGVRVDHDGA